MTGQISKLAHKYHPYENSLSEEGEILFRDAFEAKAFYRYGKKDSVILMTSTALFINPFQAYTVHRDLNSH